MKASLKYLLSLAALTTSQLGLSAEPANCSQANEECIEVGQWRVSLAAGGGVLTNPLQGGENIPLIVVPYISYYNERFFLENTTLGYTFQEAKHFDVSVILELNGEQKYFNRLHAGNIIGVDGALSDGGSSEVPTSPDSNGSEDLFPDTDKPVEPKRLPTLDDIAKRDWAIDGGLLAHWYIGKQHKITAQWAHDVSGVYKGQHIKASYKYQVPVFDWPAKLQLSAGFDWQSAELVNYYYGLNSKDNVEQAYYYQGKQGISPFVGAVFNYRINKQWQFKLSAKRTFLSSAIVDSPLVHDNHQDYLFIGGLYEF
ncbi:MipA/OmpV family protein [Pseudoalteromonas phenolica]|uniref:MipA/OmpV family protein n=1 Tax=Pseudoalteromonas phenolica TaxID=161398 RepID=UPI0007176534|nr:MipA/OmpV family protein [Pseudoalteromonas phenolica]